VKNLSEGFVLWFTGLSGSGKTTIAELLKQKLIDMGYKRIELLDGDRVRKWLSPEAGFTREDRERHLRRVAHVARLLARNGVIVLCSFVSPYESIRNEIKNIIEKDAPFILAYVKCSLETCIKRDPKGLYKRALRGEIKHMTGLDDPFDEPKNPDIVLDSEHSSPQENLEKLIRFLSRKGFIKQ